MATRKFSYRLHVRMTKEQQQQVEAYAEAHDLSSTDVVRLALHEFFSKQTSSN